MSRKRMMGTSVAIAANRPTNGTTCCMIIGTRSADMPSAVRAVKPGNPPKLPDSSVKSMM